MQRLLSPVLSLVIVAAAATAIRAQADAQQSYQQAKTAYAAGDFATARDLAQTAAKTDVKNPEVFLLLGKARYQLGELDEAIAAWQRTLALAPEEPFATRMLAALRARTADVDTRIQLIEELIRQKLLSPALQECTKLLADKAVSDSQRAKVRTLQAESLVEMNKYAEAQRILRELLVLHPQQADAVQVSFLLGKATVLAGGDTVDQGLALLKKLVADHPGTPAAARAQYELIAFDLKLGVTPARAEAMADWLAANGDHESADRARRVLLDAYFTLTRRGSKPKAESDLSPTDVKALALAAEIYRSESSAGSADALTTHLLEHVADHYGKQGAHAAAMKAAQTLLAAPLPHHSRLAVLKALGSSKYLVAAQWLDDVARAGQLPVGVPRAQLPEKLTDVLTTFQTIRREYPAEPFWIDQANLAKRVRASASRVLPTAEFRGIKGPDAWALDVALPVIEADADAAAVKSALDTALGIIQERAKLDKPGSRELAVELSTELLAAVSADHSSWAAVITSYYTVVQSYAPYVFQENIKAGRAEDNAKLSELQQAYLATLKDHLRIEARHAPFAVKQLAEHVRPWVEHGHWTVAEEAYAAVADALPEKQRRQADLAVASLWIEQVRREHRRLAATGLTVPRRLDPRLEKALARCYALQAGLDAEPSILAQVRAVWGTVVAHYKKLDYREVAEAAIRVKADPAVDAADEYADFQLVVLKDEGARRDLNRLLVQYGASEKIELGPGFQRVIEGWKKFISDRPTSTMVAGAVERIFGVGRLFEQKAAHQVAAAVYGDLAKFAAGIKVLAQAAPGTSSTAERAAFTRVAALDAHARKLLAKAISERKSDDPPPAKLSGEFAAAIAAYRGFVETYPDSPLAGDAIGRVMAAAYEYAKIDAWDVADSVYTDLLASELEVRRAERLKFARGLCQLGRVMPEHARQVLSVLTSGGLRGSGEAASAEMLAVNLPGADMDPAKRPATEPDAAGEPVGVAATPSQTRLAMPGGSRFVLDNAATLNISGGSVTLQANTYRAEAQRDSQLLAMIRTQESNRAQQIAQLRDNFQITVNQTEQPQAEGQQGAAQGQQAARRQQVPAMPVLSEAELTRQDKALSAAYGVFQGIRKDHSLTPTAEQARGEILVMVGHWRTLSQWERSAALATRFLADNPTDAQLPKIRLEVARDKLSWASKRIARKAGKQEMLAEVSKRFDAARAELARIVADFPKEKGYQQQAQWDIATSFRTQARAVAAFSPTLARGQYVRTTKELRQVARTYPNHPQIGTIPQMLWEISDELTGRGFHEEAILVLNELTIHDPMHSLAQQAALRIAQTYQNNLKRPLLAAQAYQEVNFARGGGQQDLQNAIFQIGSTLKNEKRWVEALHVLETFVDSFPRHGQAGQALTMVGQIHQTNEAWEDAIAAYRRVIAEFKNGQWSLDAKWAIAECTINLSQWREAADAYRAFVKAYPKDPKVAEADRRIEVLKGLVRYQGLVDEDNQRKAFDAQYQIAEIVRTQLSNPVKAIIEYRKVVANWPQTHLADDALYAVGTAYISLGETDKAREALLRVAADYEASPLADDALFEVGKSFEDEAGKLATVTRATTVARNKDVAQRRAYEEAQDNRFRQQKLRSGRILALKQAGKGKSAEVEEASAAGNFAQFNDANVLLFAQKAEQEVQTLTATQLADRQDKINAALRKAVEAYTSASKVAAADKADEALLQVATIYDQRLKDSQAAMDTYLEIVRLFNGTSVAENASWRIAQYYEREGKHAEAIDAYKAFLRSYRASPNAGPAQFAIAENYENLDQWIAAMDSYTNYITNFAEGPQIAKAKEQISWIKTYRL